MADVYRTDALGNKLFILRDFLLQDVGTGDEFPGRASGHGEQAAHGAAGVCIRKRGSCIFGVTTLQDAIERTPARQACHAAVREITAAEKQQLITFLSSL